MKEIALLDFNNDNTIRVKIGDRWYAFHFYDCNDNGGRLEITESTSQEGGKHEARAS